MLRLSLFGFPTVTLNDVPVTNFISQKSLVLLCYLVLEPRVHAREALAGLFWSDMPQERALGNLRQALHNIQKLLPGYVLVTRQTVALDTSRPFYSDVDLLSRDTVGTDSLIYRDGFMAGVAITDGAEIEHWISQKREYYRLRYTAYLDRLLAGLYARREMPQTEQIVRLLIEHDPYGEAAYHILWRVLVQQGRAAEALVSANALHERLRDDLDIAPTAETQRITRQLALVQDSVRHNIPNPVSPFIGRGSELEKIGHLLQMAECRLVAICGIGGVGKSRLAQELGRTEAGFYLNGAAYIPLGELADSMYLYTALADAIGLSLKNVRDPQREIAAFMAEREMLLIFDNAEHLPAFTSWLGTLLQAAPFIKTIVTSRQRLNLREEWVVMIDGLPFSESPETPSVDLFVKTAERGGHRIERNADVAALCALLEGLPLGIELAGAMAASDTTSDLLRSVRANLDHLQAPWVNAEPYHRNLRAVFQTSWDRLSAEERSALSSLAIFEGAFTGEAAQGVADASAALLRRLESVSLIRAAGEYWSLHRVIRTYAREQQAAPDLLLIRFEAYVLKVLAAAEVQFTGRNIRAAVEMMRAEIGGLRQLWKIALDQRRVLLLNRLSFTMHRYYEGEGLFAEGLSLFRTSIDSLALDRLNPDESGLLGRLRMHEAGMLLRLGNVADAFSSARDAVECLSHDEGDPAALAFALNSFGIAQLYQGEMTAARRALEQCAGIYRQLKMPELLKPLVNLGAIYSRTGDIENTRRVLREAHDLARQVGDGIGGFHIANSLGLNHMLCDEYDAARQYFEEALELSETTGFLSGKVIVLNNLGDVHTLMGQPQEGISYAQDAVALARQLQDQRGLVYGLTTLALTQLAMRQSEALITLREALERADKSQAAPLMITALYAAGEWFAAANRPDEAHRLWQLIVDHPAAEMDYRRRAVRRLHDIGVVRDTPEQPLSVVIGEVLAQLVDG